MAIAGSIIFHHFGLWAGFKVNQRTGYKFGDGNENKGRDDARWQSKVFYVDYENGGLEIDDHDRVRAIREEKKKELE